MKHLEFYDEIKNNTIKTSYVFAGEEEFIKESALSTLSNSILSKETMEFNNSLLDELADIKSCIAACETYPMMSDRRLVVWQNPSFFSRDWNKEEEKIMADFFQNIPQFTCLIIYYKGNPDKRKKGYKFLKQNSTMVDFEALNEFEAIKWIMSTAKKSGKEIDKQTANMLVQMVGTSVLDLKNELEKLVNLQETKITQADLKVVKPTNIEYNVFNMISKFLAGKTQEGMRMYYNLVESGENQFMILGALSSKFRNLYSAKSMLDSGMKSSAVLKELGGGYGAKIAMSECSKLSWSDIKRAVDAFMQADYNIKNGVMPEDTAVEFAIATAFTK